jgi:hypothetical protein
MADLTDNHRLVAVGYVKDLNRTSAAVVTILEAGRLR